MSVQRLAHVPGSHRVRSLLLPLAALAAVGALSVWATADAVPADRWPMACFGAAAGVLLACLPALLGSRSRATRLLRSRTEALRAESAQAVAAQADTAHRAQAEAESVRRAAALAESSLRREVQTQRAAGAALELELRELASSSGQSAAGTERLAEQVIPQAVKRLRAGASADTTLAQAPDDLDPTQLLILETLVREVAASERLRASSMAACANAAGRVQALATSMLADLREMENRHSEEVLGDLLQLDHGTAQAGRLADSIAVLTGARSGRRWTKPIVLESVLRGAMGRISAYQRVRLHFSSGAAVAGYAAEGVMHLLAELMDNAASFSPPTEEVHVYAQETQTGVVVTIEDGGLVMAAATLARAERLVSAEPLDLTTLSGTRLGLAVVGCLARKHGLTVSFRPSSRGGTGVVVLIPQHVLARPQDPATTAPSAASAAPPPLPAATAPPLPTASAPDPAPAAAPAPAPAPAPAGGGLLPKRPRGQTLAASLRSTEPTTERAPSRPGDASRLGAFQAAIRPAPASPSAQNGQDTDQ
ncbi:sensor histidine kinase KdpD [Streptacidiphilus sp. P02-A3a]|uniref:sensor histidine kinase n=1 Tax=Streptacidiphilus sp. P02-A3a TaxID=2704468 RepID=UPI0015FA0DB8|nr:ATP-binding protein [Streptacidiphilus sp. P02-A3a]QMU68943.1 ATP-binding protein [Streptacidiphilus sp. P02-A3a]